MDYNVYEKYIIHYFKKYIDSLKENNISSEIKIDIISPFFQILANSNLLEKLNIIIKEENLDDLIFKENIKHLRYLNDKYSLTFEYIDNKDFNYLKNFNLDFKKLKNFIFIKKKKIIISSIIFMQIYFQ